MWKVKEDKIVSKRLKKFRSDKEVLKGYLNALGDLGESNDPASLGTRKHGRLKFCYSYNVTKSHRIIHRVLRDERVIQIMDLGDHKDVFWRDNRQ